MVIDVVSCVGRLVKECELIFRARVQRLHVFVWSVFIFAYLHLGTLAMVVAEDLKSSRTPDEDREVPLRKSTGTEMELSDIGRMISVSPHPGSGIWCDVSPSYDFEGW